MSQDPPVTVRAGIQSLCCLNRHFSTQKGAPLWPVLDKGTSIPETQACGFPWDLLCALESKPDYHFRNVP